MYRIVSNITILMFIVSYTNWDMLSSNKYDILSWTLLATDIIRWSNGCSDCCWQNQQRQLQRGGDGGI